MPRSGASRTKERSAAVELRHLETLLAIAQEGSFTAAADALATVQSNVSEQVRQLEAELGVALLVRGRRGAEPTEFGVVVLDRARRIQRELEAMRADLSMLQGLESGYARLGVVGTASRWLVPSLVDDLRKRAPGVRLRVNEGASERLFLEVITGELAQAVVTEPADDAATRRESVAHGAGNAGHHARTHSLGTRGSRGYPSHRRSRGRRGLRVDPAG